MQKLFVLLLIILFTLNASGQKLNKVYVEDCIGVSSEFYYKEHFSSDSLRKVYHEIQKDYWVDYCGKGFHMDEFEKTDYSKLGYDTADIKVACGLLDKNIQLLKLDASSHAVTYYPCLFYVVVNDTARLFEEFHVLEFKNDSADEVSAYFSIGAYYPNLIHINTKEWKGKYDQATISNIYLIDWQKNQIHLRRSYKFDLPK